MNELKGAEWGLALVEECRDELNKNKGHWARLVELSGGKLTYPWVAAFATRRIKVPHIDKIAELALYLGKPLVAAEGPHFNRFPK